MEHLDQLSNYQLFLKEDSATQSDNIREGWAGLKERG
jgi:hypothetical protein